tara:strand:- start:699 stop:1094 length:396 start_codon:yes stop_codon:yes gene_type:complete
MKKNRLYFVIPILLILIGYKINFLKSLHDTSLISYDERINNTYGFCEREGVGYANFIKKNFTINDKLEITNSLKQNSMNSGHWFVYNPNFSEKKETFYLIVINYNKLNKKINLDNYKILHNFKDCYFLVKK